MHTFDLIACILQAMKFNYRATELYSKLLNQIFSSHSITKLRYDCLNTFYNNKIIEFEKNSNKVYQIVFHSEFFPKENELEYIIMYDQIDKFRDYISQKSIDKIKIDIHNLWELSPIEAAAYFGSVNIFTFLLSLGNKITKRCSDFSFIGNNTDIINECLKTSQFDIDSIFFIVSSHNNKFLDYMFQRYITKFEPSEGIIHAIIESQNIKAMLVMFDKDKNSIVPWCAAFPQSLDIIKNEGIDFSKTGRDKRNLLHFAAYYNNFDICKFLVESSKVTKIRITTKSKVGLAPLHYAAKNKSDSRDIIDLLITHREKVDTVDKCGRTALHLAALNNMTEIIETLIKLGANVNSPDQQGETPLHYAAFKNNLDSIKVLISHGAQVNARDRCGLNTYNIANSFMEKEAAALLVECGADTNYAHEVSWATSTVDEDGNEVFMIY